MLELLAYVFPILIVMPGLLLAAGKLILHYNAKLSLSAGTPPRVASQAAPDYETLHGRLVAASRANPLLPRPFSARNKGG